MSEVETGITIEPNPYRDEYKVHRNLETMVTIRMRVSGDLYKREFFFQTKDRAIAWIYEASSRGDLIWHTQIQ